MRRHAARRRSRGGLAITGTLQKVSNLILNINVHVREVEAGRLVRAASADIRGKTDDSWHCGLDRLIDNRLGLERPR